MLLKRCEGTDISEYSEAKRNEQLQAKGFKTQKVENNGVKKSKCKIVSLLQLFQHRESSIRYGVFIKRTVDINETISSVSYT